MGTTQKQLKRERVNIIVLHIRRFEALSCGRNHSCPSTQVLWTITVLRDRLIGFKVWISVAGSFWEGLGGVAYQKSHGHGLWGLKRPCYSQQFFFLCVLCVDEDVSFHYFCPNAFLPHHNDASEINRVNRAVSFISCLGYDVIMTI